MKRVNNFLYCLVLALISMASSCNPEEQPEATLPSNLNSSIEILDMTVNVAATADNANFFTFTFYEGTDSTYIESNDGTASYAYVDPGVYQVMTRAHSSYYDYIQKLETVEVIDNSFGGGIPTTGYQTPLSYPGMELIWQDEFEGNSLSADWIHEIGNDPGGLPGWGNNELQYYQADNTDVSDGLLKITAKEYSVNGFNYTSSRIKTQGLQSFKYGRIDIRAALPYGKGIWPALWMLGENIPSVSWPACGEIDIMEMIGGDGYNDRTVYGSLHWLDNGNHASAGDSKSLQSGLFAEEFHVFSIIWNATSIQFLCDDVQYYEVNITGAELSEFQEHFFFIFNIAVGGSWPGNPDNTTVFPQTMAVDYVRVFQ